jgi:hypothetical protein
MLVRDDGIEERGKSWEERLVLLVERVGQSSRRKNASDDKIAQT